MDQFKKNVTFIIMAVSTVVAIGLTVNYAVQRHAQRTEEQKIAWRKANIKALKDLSAIGALSTEEQTRVDNAGDDVDRLQQVLIDIHQERLNFWLNRAKDIADKEQSLRQAWNSYATYADYSDSSELSQAAAKLREAKSEAASDIAGYMQAKETIHSWIPMSFEAFCAKQDKPSPKNPDKKSKGGDL